MLCLANSCCGPYVRIVSVVAVGNSVQQKHFVHQELISGDAMRRLHLLSIALLILPLASGAQRFAHDPFYQKTQAVDATALQRWHSSANGVIFHMSLTVPR